MFLPHNLLYYQLPYRGNHYRVCWWPLYMIYDYMIANTYTNCIYSIRGKIKSKNILSLRAFVGYDSGSKWTINTLQHNKIINT